ncbi:hypothetical protein G3N18_13465 [Microbacterium sp. 2C]|uniref:hypothetical protein n=1 Tax=Microbacterium paulum TaxID=2707006 RepID=UPI0018C2E8AC|nr:hypothetical protein [Microbacterium paulum]MBG0719053.1 hypothetical protein [Microbacterium paulum]
MSHDSHDRSADLGEWIRRRNNTRIQVRLIVSGVIAAAFCVLAPVRIADAVGLYLSPAFYRGWIGTFEFVNGVFIIMWSSCLMRMGVNDGQHYRRGFRGPLAVTPRSNVIIRVLFAALAVIWCELVVRTVFHLRAIDPTYINHLPFGTSAETLENGVGWVVAATYAALAVAAVFYFVQTRFNPVDLDELDRRLRSRSTPKRS